MSDSNRSELQQRDAREKRSDWEARQRIAGRRARPSRRSSNGSTLLPRGLALDVAAGTGRHSVALARAGFRVVAIDYAEAALAHAAIARARRAALRMATRRRPLGLSAAARPLRRDSQRQLSRPRIGAPPDRSALRPGGALLFDTFLIDQAATGHPRNPDFMLQHYELREMLSEMDLVRYREGIVAYPDGKSAWRAAALAVRRGAHKPRRLNGARLSYKSAGVDIDLKERLVPMLRRLARPTLGPHVLGGIGGFGAMVGLDGARAMRSPVLVAGTDGVGTKLKIAFVTGRHDTVGIDCVAMCVNDIVCHAARPLFFLDYIATGKLKSAVALALVKGVARGCKLAGMSLVGGETAQMPGFYRPGEYDIAGFAVGLAERATIPRPERIRPGDVLVGLASSGLHSNGFSLVRRVLLERARLETQLARRGAGLHARRRTPAADENLRQGRDRAVRALSDSRASPISPAAA